MDRSLGAERPLSLGPIGQPAFMALYNAFELEPNSEIIARAINAIEGQEVVSITSHGEKLTEVMEKSDGKIHEKNRIKDAFQNLLKHKIDPPLPKGKTFKTLRSTGSSLLEAHETYGRFLQLYLGHVPQNIKEAHYAAVPQNLFDNAIDWLGEKLGIA